MKQPAARPVIEEEDEPVVPQTEPEGRKPIEAEDMPEAEPDEEVEAPENNKPLM